MKRSETFPDVWVSDCCEEGELIWFDEKRDKWVIDFENGFDVAYCPFCGDYLPSLLTQPRLEELLTKIATLDGKGRRICFDADGVIVDDRDDVAYEDRKPYPFIPEIIRALKKANFKIIVQTARYQIHQTKYYHEGVQELKDWLTKYEIPFDEVYFWKTSACVYVDDKGCRVQSNHGVVDWNNKLLPLLKE
jgi:hypothetical protein